MKKPYDERFIPSCEIAMMHDLIRDSRMLLDWLKFKLQADEIEVVEDQCRMGITVRYKRNVLQYG